MWGDTSVPLDLLRQLGRRSLELYSQEVLLPGHGPLVHRDVVETIQANALPGGPGLSLVTGRSGYGKSVAVVQALDQWLSAGSLGFWLPARILRDAASIESALDAWLRSLHPLLRPDAGRAAIDIAGKEGRLLLCVDDINRTHEAARLLRIAVGSAAPPSGGPGQAKPNSGVPLLADAIHLVVPVWPEQLSTLPAKVLDLPWVHIITVGDLLPDQCSEMIRAKIPMLSSVEASGYATLLNRDPLLVGLFTLMAEEQMDARQLQAVAEDTLRKFLDAQLREVCTAAASDLLPGELLEVLARIARDMILRRNLHPSWPELEGWLGDGSKALRGMLLLVRQGHVCRLDAESRLVFRHDRLQDQFLVESMVSLLQLPPQPSDIVGMAGLLQLPAPPEEVINDPYFSTLVGQALARTQLSAERLVRLRGFAPWAVFEAIRQVGEPLNEHQNRLFQEALAFAANESESVPDSVLRRRQEIT